MISALVLILFLGPAAEEPLRVAVAASLRDAIGDLAPHFEAASGRRFETVVGSSGQLASQVRYGAPIDVLVSAAEEPLKGLERDRLIVADSIRQFASNRLALVVPAESKNELGTFRDLSRPAIRRIVIGEPATVPAGQYASQVFDALNIANALRGKIIHASNVRQVLAYVERGEVDAGVVYITDARISAGRVRVIELADPAWHQPIRYSAAIVERSQRRESARAFVEFLATAAARGVLERHGFLIPSPKQDARAAPASQPAATAPQTNTERPPTSAPVRNRPAASAPSASMPVPGATERHP